MKNNTRQNEEKQTWTLDSSQRNTIDNVPAVEGHASLAACGDVSTFKKFKDKLGICIFKFALKMRLAQFCDLLDQTPSVVLLPYKRKPCGT